MGRLVLTANANLALSPINAVIGKVEALVPELSMSGHLVSYFKRFLLGERRFFA